MSQKSCLNRNYTWGKSLSLELWTLIIDKVKESRGSIETGKVPYGALATVAKSLNLYRSTVSKMWKHFLIHGTVETYRGNCGHERILTSEDVEYIRQLILLKPTLYQREIRELVLQNTNHIYPSLSLSTIQNTV